MIMLRSTVATMAALALTASLSAAAMATDETEPQPLGVYSIEGMTWLLTSQAVDGTMVPVPEQALVTLLMEDGHAGGNGGCNSYFASYELDGFDVTFGEIGSTLMACLGPAADIESAYFTNLGKVAAYQSGGIQMAFLDAEGNFILEYKLAPQASIVGSWVATGINDGVGVVTQAITSEVSAEFDADGDLTGSDGCNDYFTSYQVEDDTISISDAIGTTRMACASDELTQQSQQYFAALAAATTWSVDPSGQLQLRDDNGSLQVSYEPAAS